MKSPEPILDEKSRDVGKVVNELARGQHWRTLNAEQLCQALRIPVSSQLQGGVLLESGARGPNYDRFVGGALMCAGRMGVEAFETTMFAVYEAVQAHRGVALPASAVITEAVYAVFSLLRTFPCVHIALELFNHDSDPERQRLVQAFQAAARIGDPARAQAALNIALATLLGGSHATDASGNAVSELMVSAVYHVLGVETPASVTQEPQLTPQELFVAGPKKGQVLN